MRTAVMRMGFVPPVELAGRIVIVESGCWEWKGPSTKGGYGLYRQTTAHRWSYRQIIGPIPEGLQLDHLCRNRICVNPGHLEPVTCRKNLLRGNTVTAAKAAQTHCIHGHIFDQANTHIRANGTRQCRTCDRLAHRRKKYAGQR